MTEILETIKERYQIEVLTIVPYDSLKRSQFLGYEDHYDPVYEKIYLLDKDGAKLAEVEAGQQVEKALEALAEKRKSVAFIISKDFAELSSGS